MNLAFWKGWKTKPNELKPYFEKDRPPCPFYGFYGALSMGVMMDQEGNQCALITDSYSPCRMKINNQIPNYNECPHLNADTRKTLEEIAEKIHIFPGEFNPPDKKSWEGITLRQWMNYILKKPKESYKVAKHVQKEIAKKGINSKN